MGMLHMFWLKNKKINFYTQMILSGHDDMIFLFFDFTAGSSSAGATAMNSESETDEADMGRLQGNIFNASL